jgi:hypothetical protein
VSKGEPIQPLDNGRQTIISGMTGLAFIAERKPDGTGQIYALRLFTGDVEGRQAGDTFDAYHKVCRIRHAVTGRSLPRLPRAV